MKIQLPRIGEEFIFLSDLIVGAFTCSSNKNFIEHCKTTDAAVNLHRISSYGWYNDRIYLVQCMIPRETIGRVRFYQLGSIRNLEPFVNLYLHTIEGNFTAKIRIEQFLDHLEYELV